MVDYRKLIGQSAEVVAPYFGGSTVRARDRVLRVATEPSRAGWWRFQVRGRVATPMEAVDAPDISLPSVRGHFIDGRLAHGRADARIVQLLPEAAPAPFAPLVTRRWVDGSLLFESEDFETDAEEAVRRAWEDDVGIGDVKGVASTLRAAFAFAVAQKVARAAGTELRPAEVRRSISAISEGGRAAAEELLDAVQERRADARRQREAWARQESGAPAIAAPAREEHRRNRRDRSMAPEDRADHALEEAGARMTSCRRLDSEQLEVRFELDGERFITIVNESTLQVMDAGICLDGADREVTLESLPSVIREAVDTDQLVIMRHG